MQISSERLSERFFEINSCNVQQLTGREYRMVRERGRVDYHVLYIMQGCCHVMENGKELSLDAGHLILYRPNERQEYRFAAEDCTVSAYVHFSGTACAEILDTLGVFSDRFVFVGTTKRLERLFRDTVDVFRLKRPCWQESAAALLLQFLAEAARTVAYGKMTANGALEREIDEVVRYMHGNYAENHDVAFYAAMCHLSEGRFAHVFKASTGYAPKNYLLRIRMNVALELLATTSLSVGEVAAAVGVSDVNYFSRLIKKHTGRTPRDQR